MIISFIITSKRLFFLTFSLGLGLSVFPNNNDFEVSQDSLQLLQNIVVNKIESEETINVLDDILKIEDLLEDNPKSIILAGIISMIIFFSFCFIASQLAIKYLTQ